MTITSKLCTLGLASFLTITGLAVAPAAATAEPLTIKVTHQVKPQLVHRRHRTHRWHRHYWRHHHHHRHFPRLGHRIHRLPRGFFGITFGGARFYVHRGIFHRPARTGFVVVKAPYGVVIGVLPQGYRIIHRGPHTYYHYNDTYYAKNRSGSGYVVIPKPLG